MMRFNHKNIIWAGILFAQILLFYLCSKSPEVVRYHNIFFEWQKQIHLWAFHCLLFSIGDVFYLGLIILLIKFLYLGFKKRKFYLSYLLIGLNLFYFFYQIFWGMLYFQEPLIDKLSSSPSDKAKLETLTLKYLIICKDLREKVSEEEKGVFKIRDLSKVEQEILKNQQNIPEKFRKNPLKNNSFKPSLFSPIMSFTGISGYYNPLSAEAQYNRELPDSYLPFTLAHENAHQLGYAREQEANFVGYLLGTDSENLDLKYSTNWFVLKSLLRYQIVENQIFVENIKEGFSDGMKRDYDNEVMFLKEHQGHLESLFSTLNDWFLKSNQQEGSVTYNYFVDLLIKYENEKRVAQKVRPQKHK